MTKLDEAKDILNQIGMPIRQQSDLCRECGQRYRSHCQSC